MSEIDTAVAKLEVQVQRLEDDVTEMKADIKAMRAVLDRADGGIRTFLIIGSAGAAIATLALKALGLLKV